MDGGYGFRMEYIGDWERMGGDLGIWRSGLGTTLLIWSWADVLHALGGLMHIWIMDGVI